MYRPLSCWLGWGIGIDPRLGKAKAKANARARDGSGGKRGVLRLCSCFASRSGYSAQDDKFIWLLLKTRRLAGIVDYQNHAGTQGGYVAVVLPESAYGGVVGIGDRIESLSRLDFVMDNDYSAGQ